MLCIIFMLNTAYIALGSNLGDKEQNIKKAISLLAEKCEILKISSFSKTEPVGFLDQDWFLNGVVKIETDLNPLELLKFLKKIEVEIGRIKTFKNGPRIIDLDILFYNKIILNQKDLIIPHPNLHKRLFVLEPMSEIDSNFIHPVSQKNIKELTKERHML